VLYFIVPDTRGLSFDELDYLYANKVSPRRFQEAIKERIERGEEILEVNTSGKTIITHIDHKIVPLKTTTRVAEAQSV
jgi:hypothetical protein